MKLFFHNHSRLVVLTFALSFLVITIFALMLIEEPTVNQISNLSGSKPLARVSVTQQSLSDQQSIIEILAEVESQQHSQIKAAVRGNVEWISPKLAAGNWVTAGEVLLKIESSHYQMQVEDAKRVLTQAELNLVSTQQQADQAKRNWQRSGFKGQPDSPLAFYEPQLALANAETQAAGAALAAMQQQLGLTTIKAPYSGVITERFINFKEHVEVGELFFTIINPHQLTIPVYLNKRQFDNLAAHWTSKLNQGLDPFLEPVELFVASTANHEQTKGNSPASLHTTLVTPKSVNGYVRAVSNVMDSESRQRKIYIDVNHPDFESTANHSNNNQPIQLEQLQQLIPGSMVKVRLRGLKYENLLSAPATSLTPNGFLWFVDAEDRLQRESITPLFTKDKTAFFHPPTSTQVDPNGYWRVITTPLASYLPGQKVIPIPTEQVSLSALSVQQQGE